MASGEKNTMKNWAPTNWLDWFERQGEGEGQGNYMGSLYSRPEKFHTRGGRRTRPWEGLCPAWMPEPRLPRRRHKFRREEAGGADAQRNW